MRAAKHTEYTFPFVSLKKFGENSGVTFTMSLTIWSEKIVNVFLFGLFRMRVVFSGNLSRTVKINQTLALLKYWHQFPWIFLSLIFIYFLMLTNISF